MTSEDAQVLAGLAGAMDSNLIDVPTGLEHV